MKLLVVSAFLIACAPLSGAQAPHTSFTHGTQTAHIKPKQNLLPQTTLEFKPVGDALPVSADAVFVGNTVCANGRFYFNAIMLPGGEKKIIAVSPTGEVRNYSLTSQTGLVNVASLAMDAESSDINVLVAAAKRTDLLNHDVDPHSNDVGRYMKRFIIQFHGEMSAPDIIPLDLPFQPMQFAATSDGKFIFLGLERTNQTPVLAAVNGSGELEHYIDAYQDFGTNESIVANAPQQLKSQFKSMQGALLGYTLLAAQFVHYRDSLLLLMPGSKPMVFTIRGGGVEGTALHLPAGLEADSFVPSNDKWIVRATDGTANGKRVLVVVDPTTGDALRIIRSPQVKANAITCVDDGNYYAIQWPVPQKGNEKVFLMKAAE